MIANESVAVFDLPKELSSPRLETALLPDSALASSTTAVSTNSGMFSSGDYQQVPVQQPLEGWGFLRDFGDSTDDFFALDVEFRDLLDGQFVTDQNGFL